MKIFFVKSAVLFPITAYLLLSLPVLSASPTHAFSQAKEDAITRRYLSPASRAEVIAHAQTEGSMAALSSLDPLTIQAAQEAFKKEYPFLKVSIEEITGSDAMRRFLMELKAGRDTPWDAIHMATDSYDEFVPFMKKADILSMSERSVLHIPPRVVDPVNRNIITVTSGLHVVAYNKKLLSPDMIPRIWEDLLKPEYKGRKILADIRPTEITALVPAWGLDKTLDFSRKLASQQPIWIRGATRMLTAMVAGEYGIFIGPGIHSVKRVQAKDPSGSLDYTILEPVPVRLSDANGVLHTARHPFAALLWLDFLAGPKGQKIIDHYEPCAASIYSPGSFLSEAIRGKKLSMVGWDHFAKIREYQEKIVEAYGFPTAEKKK